MIGHPHTPLGAQRGLAVLALDAARNSTISPFSSGFGGTFTTSHASNIVSSA